MFEKPQEDPIGSCASRRAACYKLEESEKALKEIVAWMREYWTHPEQCRVYPNAQPVEIRESVAGPLPRKGRAVSDVFADFKKNVLPGLLHWNHPGFFGFFPCNTSGPSAVASLLSSTLNVNPFSWNAGPSATELEFKVVQWLAEAVGLPWTGVLQDTASSATLCAVIAARERAWRSREVGLRAGPELIAYASEEVHSSVKKALYIAGMGKSQLRLIPTEETLAMQPQALSAAIQDDLAAGRTPFFVCSTLGTTSSTAFDPVGKIADVLESHGERLASPVWHHVDAALAGNAAILPEMQWMMEGVSRADSFVFNPHKWLFTNFECSVLLVRNPQPYKDALSEDAAYLRDANRLDKETEDLRDWTLQLGRGFRGLKLWFVLQSYGLDGIKDLLRNHLKLTRELYSLVSKDSRFITLQPPLLNTFCIRLADEAATTQFYQNIVSRGRIYLTPTRIRNTFWIRIAIGQTAVQPEDIDLLWRELSGLSKTTAQA